MRGIGEDRSGVERAPGRASRIPARTARITATAGWSTSRNDIGPPTLPDKFSQARATKSSMMI